MEDVKAILSAHIQQENRRNIIEKWHFRLIPGRYYQKLEYWLGFEFGSTLRPETWLIRLELSLLLGLLVILGAYSMPLWITAALLGFCVTLVSFLYASRTD